MNYDQGTASYYRYRLPYPTALFEDIASHIGLSETSSVLDLCSGSGEICGPISERVGRVVGVDRSGEMMTRTAARPRLRIVAHDVNAEDLPSVLGTQAFDCFTIGRAIHWVAEAGLARLTQNCLVDGGAVIILGTGWSRHTAWLERYEKLRRRYAARRGRVDFRGEQKLRGIGLAFSERLSLHSRLRFRPDFLIGNALSYSNSTAEILQDLDRFKAELEAAIAPDLSDGMLEGVSVAWADIWHKPRG
jgi:SAM-dependent methyltransferase